MNFRPVLDTIRAYRAGAPLGDVVVMKLDAGLPPPETLAQARGAARLRARSGSGRAPRAAGRHARPRGTPVCWTRTASRRARERCAEGTARTNPWALRYTGETTSTISSPGSIPASPARRASSRSTSGRAPLPIGRGRAALHPQLLRADLAEPGARHPPQRRSRPRAPEAGRAWWHRRSRSSRSSASRSPRFTTAPHPGSGALRA